MTFSTDDLDESNARQIEKHVDLFKPRFGSPITGWWRWFAWYPVETVDRGRVWFRQVYRRRIVKYAFLDGGTDFWFQHSIRPNGGSDV